MTGRSYRQHCSLALALDALGERWTLLIIRDLLPGPRRFGDLFEALPGISTDLLAARLRKLAALGLVEQQRLRYPVVAKVYSLTEAGEELRAVVAQLAKWGEKLLPEPPSAEHRLNHRWALASMAADYSGGLADGSYVLEIDDDPVTISVNGERARLRYGRRADTPLLEIRCPSEWFFLSALAGTTQPLTAGIEITGQELLADTFFRLLPLPAPARPQHSQI